MLIPNHDLVALIRETGVRSNPVSANQVRFTLRSLEQAGIDADSNSEASISLQRLVAKQRTLLTTEAQTYLERVVLFGLDTLLCDAIPVRHRNHDCILVHIGLLQLLRYYTDLQLLIDLLKDEPIEIEIAGSATQIGLAMSLAGHAIFIAALESGHQLIDLSLLLGQTARQRSDYGYGGAALFLVLHEVGHHVLGHTSAGYKSERVAMETRIPESIAPTQQMEADADAFALQCFVPELRALVLSSVMFAFGPFAFLETFRGPLDAHHPLTVNRLAALSSIYSSSVDIELQTAVSSIIDAHVNRFMRLESDRLQSGGDISGRIAEHMPLREAHEVMDTIGRIVRERYGALDFCANSASG